MGDKIKEKELIRGTSQGDLPVILEYSIDSPRNMGGIYNLSKQTVVADNILTSK